MKTPPLVSIVTPSYNQGQFIEETMQSVKSQDYPNLEHVVVDGASTDGTVEILKKYEGTYNMRWLSEPDRGHADALRKGFRQSKGEILAWLNSDDIYMEGAVSKAVRAFQDDRSADLVYGDVYIIDEKGRPLDERRLTQMDLYDFIGHGNCLAQPATFWTRKAYERVGGIDPTYYFQFDLDFFIRVTASGRIKHLRSFLAKMRIHPDGKMVRADDVRKSDLADIQNQYMHAKGLERLMYNRYFLMARLFIRLALQGDLSYASRKAFRRFRWSSRDG